MNINTTTDIHGETGNGWYGFDLDGTLAVYNGWKGIDHIGAPIKPMVDRIKRMHDEGKVVKIMTARVAPKDEPETRPNPYFTDGVPDYVRQNDNSTLKYLYYSRFWTAKIFIMDWCLKNLCFIPEITYEKNGLMISLYDDRVKQVILNEGILVEDKIKELEAQISKPMIEDNTTSKMRKALEATLAAFKSGAIHTCSECYRDEWEDELNYLKDDVELALEAPPQPVQNVTAMREALEKIREAYFENEDGFPRIDCTIVPNLEGLIDSVLENPPRNCDRFHTGNVEKDVDDALREIIANGQDKCPRDVVKWLLKSVEEKNHEL